MTESADRIDGKPPRFSFFKGRSSRKEYWIFVGAMVAAAVALDLMGLNTKGGVIPAALLAMIQARRLRDFGWSGWWALAIFAVQAGVTLAALFALPSDGAAVVALALNLIPLIALGAIPGDPLDNRYGTAPGKRSLKEIFS